MNVEKYLTEAGDPKPKGYKLIKVPPDPDMCGNCQFFDEDRLSDMDICLNPINVKNNDTDINLFVSETGWCPQHKRRKGL